MQTKSIKEYNKALQKFQDKKPVSEKQERALGKARLAKKLNKATDEDKERVNRLVSKAKEQFKDRKAYSIKYMLFTMTPQGQMTGGFTVNGKKFYPLLVRPSVRSANVKSNEFIETIVKRKIPNYLMDRFIKRS